MSQEDTAQRLQLRPPQQPRTSGPIVPPGSIAGRALVAVISIMTFLACLAVGAVVLVSDTAREWQRDVGREVTVQVRPIDGVDLDRELARASDILRATAGIAVVRVLSRADNERLLAPWLGQGLPLDALPIPRLIVLELDQRVSADLGALRVRLAQEIRGASLDDHRQWRDRLALVSRSVVALGVVILILVMTATALSVVFATRGAMASNRDIVDVLHFVGAEDSFIAREFQHRFLVLGLEGGIYGGLAALLAFLSASGAIRFLYGQAGEQQLALLFGSFAIGWTGLAGIIVTVGAVAAVTAVTSRWTVRRYLAA